ncbi:hypothetical protein KKF64_02750 [Patescibacteria group bacterium]|nr:hypothetical protein [Patescibacteria group bacterium]
MTKSFKKYYSAVKYLETLASSAHDQAYMKKHSAQPEQYLKRTQELIKRLHNPVRGFRFIHISGTSGKGSTVAYLHNILYKAGFKVGSFTSPYCTTSIEKIKVDDKLIDPLVFAQLVDEVKPIINDMSAQCGSSLGGEKNYKYGRPSYFEIFFALSILYFKKMKCDYVILEVGCGGRYDAGNIIKKSISACTNIGLDHTHLLGKTLPKIAKEKAGIIKLNTHFFTTEKRPHILKIFKQICKSKKTSYHHIKSDNKFQLANKALAKAIAKHIGIKNNIISSAIKSTQLLPCRFEIMQKNPLIILDGAHNPDKMKSVVHNLKNLTYDKLYTIFAASNTKDARKMISIILPYSDKIVFTEFKTADRTSYAPETLSKFQPEADQPLADAKKLKKKSIQHDSLKALKQTIKKLRTNDALLITGSLYLTGKLRKYWIKEKFILNNRETCQIL